MITNRLLIVVAWKTYQILIFSCDVEWSLCINHFFLCETLIFNFFKNFYRIILCNLYLHRFFFYNPLNSFANMILIRCDISSVLIRSDLISSELNYFPGTKPPTIFVSTRVSHQLRKTVRQEPRGWWNLTPSCSPSTRTFPIRYVQRVGVTLIIPPPTVIIMQLRRSPLNAITINKSHVMSAPRSCRPRNSINKAGGVRVSIVSRAASIRTLPNLGRRMGPR